VTTSPQPDPGSDGDPVRDSVRSAGMAKAEKVTVSLSGDAVWLAERAAGRAGMSLSTWLSRAACHYAMWQFPSKVSDDEQLRDEQDRTAEEAAYRAAG
jgi:hypothetical protein